MRHYTLKAKEGDYLNKMVSQLNMELSPFKDSEKQDSQFLREMLDNYRVAEDFERSTTDKKIIRGDTQVHEYLKIMESGESHPDTETIRQLNQGILDKESKQVKEYLIKKLNAMPQAM